MKARVVKPRALLLYYNLEEEKKSGILKLCEKIGAEHREIMPEETGEQIGCLAGFGGFSKSGEKAQTPDKECVIFCMMDNRTVNLFVNEMRSGGLVVDLKAVVTPANQSWKFCDLVCELEKEHRAMHNA